MIRVDNMIMIGSFGRNSGKTEIAEELIKKFRNQLRISALKVTTITECNGKRICPQGDSGCGVCALISGDYCLDKETGAQPGKDTSRLLAAGADPVFWLRSLRGSLLAGFKDFMTHTSTNTLVICESNSLREYVEPYYFIMIKNVKSNSEKPSALRVSKYADLVIENNFDKAQLVEAVERLPISPAKDILTAAFSS